MAVVVTGGSGFIGSNIALRLQEEGRDVIVIDDFLKGHFKNLEGFEGEIMPESILEADLDGIRDLEAVYHQAAITDTTVADQKLAMNVNYVGFRRLLGHAVKKNIPFIYASSAAVYGNAPAPQREENAGCPSNIYGFSKWLCDCTAKRYMEEYESPIVGLRYFNVFGPGEGYKGKMASMILQLSSQMLEGKSPRIFKYGEQKRDQVYVDDVVTANLLAAKAKRSCIVNVGSGESVTFNHVINVLNEVLGLDHKPIYFDNPYKDFYQEETTADLTLARKCLDYEPKWKFKDAVRDYMSRIGAAKR
ncbi:MAG: ADP-glyceromanno-heptose 6-epimerase [Candidatus Altiarchaeota archaeon]|nr:ADP-glyceromanno-heptose 6-epimerase [Candidatus Altiarchaeota archaeon]